MAPVRAAKENFMEFEPADLMILRLLAKEWRHSGPPGILDISQIVAALDQAPSDTFDALMRLFKNGLVGMNELENAAFLTPEGYDAAEDSY
jgi:hypothetical protein